MIIAVDFDGTCVTHRFPEIGEDIGAVPVLKELVASGHDLILYTMRSNDVGTRDNPEVMRNFLDDAIQWFQTNEIPLLAHQENPTQKTWTKSPKCYAHLYIDDAALGIPLKHDGERECVDWVATRLLLQEKGIL